MELVQRVEALGFQVTEVRWAGMSLAQQVRLTVQIGQTHWAGMQTPGSACRQIWLTVV